MKKVLSAGVILLAGVAFLPARAQVETPPQTGNEVVKEAKPKGSQKSGAATKAARSSSSRATTKKADPPTQSVSTPGATQAASAASYYEIGMSHYESKRFKDAVKAFEQSIRLGSTEPKTYFNLGQAYYSLQLYKEAREAYKRAVKLKPDWAEAHYQLGWLNHILGDKESSLAQYKILQTLNPEMADKFQKLLDDDEKMPAPPNATNNGATVTKETANANPPEAAAADKNRAAAPPVESSASPTAAPPAANMANQQALESETKPGLTGNSGPTDTGTTNSNGASANSSGVSASPVSMPAKDETAATEPLVSSSELPLPSIYRVGVGDVLDIRLLNSPTSRSTLFTVMSGGLIEYALVGGPFTVGGLTTDEISARLTAELKRRGINDGLQVVVGVRDYTSHAVIVGGLVNYPGTKILRREAVPLYVLITEAQPRPDASRAVIMRANESIPISDINDPVALNVLVKPGDVITLSARQLQYYFIGGRINSPGQKLYQPGITLIQAILAAGGLSRSQDTVEISREEADGRLATTRYVLKEIKSGKIPDPRLQPGDRIEVGH